MYQVEEDIHLLEIVKVDKYHHNILEQQMKCLKTLNS